MKRLFEKFRNVSHFGRKILKKDLIGKWGERKACSFLKKNKIFIEDKNVSSYLSEIDIIGFKKRELYFFEVKTRNFKNAMNFPIFETIDDKKIANIKKGIKIYLNHHFHIIQRRRILRYYLYYIFIHYEEGVFNIPKVKEIIVKKTLLND